MEEVIIIFENGIELKISNRTFLSLISMLYKGIGKVIEVKFIP